MQHAELMAVATQGGRDCLYICPHIIHACLTMVALFKPVYRSTDIGQCLQATGMCFMYNYCM